MTQPPYYIYHASENQGLYYKKSRLLKILDLLLCRLGVTKYVKWYNQVQINIHMVSLREGISLEKLMLHK